MTTPDYSIDMQDSAGRTCTLTITGACVDELISNGYTPEDARESVESNQFGNAIARGDIAADAYLVRRTA